MKISNIISKHTKVFVYHYCDEDWSEIINKYVINYFNSKYNENIKFIATKKPEDCDFLPCLKFFNNGIELNRSFCIDNEHFFKFLDNLYLTCEKIQN